jgi:thiol-disulfide isomerase/thioredoxin
MDPDPQSQVSSLNRAPPAHRRWLRRTLEAAAVVAAIAALQTWLTRDVVRGPMPEIDVALLDGVRAADWQSAHRGRTYVVYVWGTWCTICSAMHGNLDAVARNTPVLTIAQRSGNDAEVQRFLQVRNLRWSTVSDADGAISERLGITAVPLLLFVDADGDVRAVTRGYTTEPGIRLRLWWAATRP